MIDSGTLAKLNSLLEERDELLTEYDGLYRQKKDLLGRESDNDARRTEIKREIDQLLAPRSSVEATR